jgi:hypothetical protein
VSRNAEFFRELGGAADRREQQCNDRVKNDRVKIVVIIEGDSMSQVTGTYTITVAPAVAALAINPATATEPAETQGVALTPAVIATVSGGVPPYTYAVSGLPSGTGLSLSEGPSADGVTGDADITLSGTPNAADVAASPITVTVVATDSAGAVAQVARKL